MSDRIMTLKLEIKGVMLNVQFNVEGAPRYILSRRCNLKEVMRLQGGGRGEYSLAALDGALENNCGKQEEEASEDKTKD